MVCFRLQFPDFSKSASLRKHQRPRRRFFLRLFSFNEKVLPLSDGIKTKPPPWTEGKARPIAFREPCSETPPPRPSSKCSSVERVTFCCRTSLTLWIIGCSQSMLTSQWLSRKVRTEAEAELAPRTRERIRPGDGRNKTEGRRNKKKTQKTPPEGENQE